MLKVFLKKNKNLLLFHLILNVAFLLLITLSSYAYIPLSGFNSYFYYFVHLLLLQFSVFGFLYILSINRFLFNILFPILFLIFSLFSFWVYTLDISISATLIQAIFELKDVTIFDTLSIPFIVYLLFILLVIYSTLKFRRKIKSSHLNIPLLVLSTLGILTFFIIENKRNNTFKSRLPYNIITSTEEYLKKDPFSYNSIDKTLSSERNDINIVFVLGESVRADHLQLNGYERETTPLLSKTENVVSYSDVFSPLTFTAASVPQILTDKSIKDYNNNNSYYTVYDVLNNLNIETIWLGNQNPEKNYLQIVEKNTSVFLTDKYHSLFSFKNKAYDSILITPFYQAIKRKKHKFTTLQMIGSHWYYENRYPNKFKVFTPTIKSKFIPSNTKEEMINSYDNTILYLDYFLENIISKISSLNEKSLLIYLSDHGEILGENEKWLHAQEDKASQNPAMIVWSSDEFTSTYPELIAALKENSTKIVSTDFFYHSILDLLQVKNINYEENKSIFREGNY
jgi:lipid A ethanolaminephosphotransferase